jgi:rSAM/selenodomain-associated transferase 1
MIRRPVPRRHGRKTNIRATSPSKAMGTLSDSSENPAAERLLVFTRYPVPGRTKSRLIPALGEEGAATLQRQMTEHVLSRVRKFVASRSVSVEIRFEGGAKDLLIEWLGSDFPIRSQGEGNLGARMERAFRSAFEEGVERVVAVGTDCPGLSAKLMGKAFEALTSSEVVVGPAEDGGYYLIGLRKPVPELFSSIPWGTGEVLLRTLSVAKGLGLSVVLLEPRQDVDRPEDLGVWQREA